ncbi:MAG: phosphoribosylformylglycinamidine synthase I [Elusimicrobia bacterium]|nr:phosphoribosylformylglycinamidine synthase I [Elusimicrobiota bacterium]
MKIRALILKAPGTNCDQETSWALELAGAFPETKYLGELVENPALLDQYGFLFLPGGFSYGDYLGSGKVLALMLESSLAEALARFIESGRRVIGVCNGFQVLVKLGMLPGWGGEPAVTLTFNDSGRFQCRWVHCKFESSSVLSAQLATRNSQLATLFELPVAHGEGRFLGASKTVIQKLKRGRQVFLRYQGDNPNGSDDMIAGITNLAGNVIGLMPHPERFVSAGQHYNWHHQKTQPWGLEFLKSIIKN